MDTVVAVPHDKGFLDVHMYPQVIVQTAEPGEAFELDVEENFDYVVMLMDTQSSDRPCVAGYVTMSADGASGVDFPISSAESDVDLRILTQSGDEAQSEATLDELDDAFTLTLEEGKRYLLNPGSIGQPRDRDPRAAFFTYDSETRTVRWQRVEYAIEKAQERIVRSGLPKVLADRLALGI